MTALAIVASAAVVVLVGALVQLHRSRAADAARLASAQQRLEDALAAARRRADGRTRALRALDALPQGVVICDADGEVLAHNSAAGAFFGARHGEALVEAAIGQLRAAGARGEALERTVELVGPPPRTLVLAVRPVEGGAVVTVDDVSERRRVDALRRDFVANISHELRTPVGALALLAETLLDEAAAGPDDAGAGPDVVARLAERIYHEALRLGRTIDDLLELSRIEAGEPLQRRPVAVEEVVAAAVERTGPAAELRDVDIRSIVPDGELFAGGDRRQLVTAIANLVDNAVKYSDRGGSVEVEAHRLADGVRFVVRDHGIGIPESDRERVFERFYRVDRARRRDTGGTGLGLAIVRHVAINHGGSVDFTSREGEGSTFTLVIPGPDLAGVDPAGTVADVLAPAGPQRPSGPAAAEPEPSPSPPGPGAGPSTDPSGGPPAGSVTRPSTDAQRS